MSKKKYFYEFTEYRQYKCCLCGRIMHKPTPHICNRQYIKHKLIFLKKDEEIGTTKEECNMTKEEIKYASKDYVNYLLDKQEYHNENYTEDDIRQAFEKGAMFADNNPDLSSLWHDASEEPKGDDWKVLCQDKYGTYFIVEYRPYDSECDITWDEYTNSLFISKWAHITDLLPKGGEK